MVVDRSGAYSLKKAVLGTNGLENDAGGVFRRDRPRGGKLICGSESSSFKKKKRSSHPTNFTIKSKKKGGPQRGRKRLTSWTQKSSVPISRELRSLHKAMEGDDPGGGVIIRWRTLTTIYHIDYEDLQANSVGEGLDGSLLPVNVKKGRTLFGGEA